jgi:hypothetical protein
MPRVAHPANGAGAAEGVPSRPQCSPAGVCAWLPRYGVLVRVPVPHGHRSAHPFQRG